MTINIQDLIEILAIICEEKQLNACATESLKGGLITGLAAVLGGLLLGPAGFAIGGAVGGTTAAISSQGKFKPVALILRNLSSHHKKKLHEKIVHAFQNVGIEDLATLSMLLLSQTKIQELALNEVRKFLTNEMNMRIRNSEVD